MHWRVGDPRGCKRGTRAVPASPSASATPGRPGVPQACSERAGSSAWHLWGPSSRQQRGSGRWRGIAVGEVELRAPGGPGLALSVTRGRRAGAPAWAHLRGGSGGARVAGAPGPCLPGPGPALDPPLPLPLPSPPCPPPRPPATEGGGSRVPVPPPGSVPSLRDPPVTFRTRARRTRL